MNVLCIAGFPGSGKTTILLEAAHGLTEAGASLAVIENEIGEVGVDGGRVREHGLPVQELFGGCICCPCRSASSKPSPRCATPTTPTGSSWSPPASPYPATSSTS